MKILTTLAILIGAALIATSNGANKSNAEGGVMVTCETKQKTLVKN